MNKNQYKITEEDEGVRLDKLLASVNESYSRHQVQTWIKNKDVTVNNQPQKANYRCKQNDLIEWHIQEVKQEKVEPEKIPLDILYEDDDVIVINKPKGMLVHPTQTVKSNTLVNALKFHTTHLSDLGGEERPGIVHRLDQDTSGALVIAKDNETHAHLKNQFKNKSVIRIYEAVVFGVMAHDKGVIKAPIGRNPKNRLEMAVVSGGKEAETHFRVIKRFQQYTHVQCELKTGRTHQIRVHMKYIQHPIVGDEVYCRKKSPLIKGQALFAKQLRFIHPKTNEWMTFTVEQPPQFKHLLKKLQNMS
ncbi:RluA family pseudouridine synthase [Pseudogracilibacillus auburnensis]|uniref:Pseudouridine synthase n=1 Tax=Pseudogracilibacillus auburnensis TaxID=1494959 RepID=A0A2V3W2L2_9BACI|nr:RluA family pseudouridine synthase [Pseudogracilibacillus auburnensis]MBO1005211.1 RluA family pseudouridine synthase [Pseudogracilibacillus auburnensis]PXW88537.1 ribosomal large subunit pseudouridine synthase D [Pseudogracilibacillus auburnensis]